MTHQLGAPSPASLGGGGKKSLSEVEVEAEIFGAFFPNVASNFSETAAATSGSSAASHFLPTSTASGSPSLCTACSARSTSKDLYLPASVVTLVAAAVLAAERAAAKASSLARRTLRRDSLTCLERSLGSEMFAGECGRKKEKSVNERRRKTGNAAGPPSPSKIKIRETKSSHLLLDLDGGVPALELARDAGLFGVEQRQLLDVEFLGEVEKEESKREKRETAKSEVREEEEEEVEKEKTEACLFSLLSSFLYLFRGHGDLRGLLLGLLPDEPDHLVDLALDLFWKVGEKDGESEKEKMSLMGQEARATTVELIIFSLLRRPPVPPMSFLNRRMHAPCPRSLIARV